MHKFIHFGCWNQGFCDKKNSDNSISKVMKLLQNKVDGVDGVDFIVVAGDNYYPKKIVEDVRKKKIIEPWNLKSGFDCLPDKIQIYMLLGNHDIETNTSTKNVLYIKDQNESDQKSEEGNCFILNKEIQ